MMDKLTDAIELNQNQQAANDAIVSSMATATPVTSEIVTDFDTDPKFEITPLEKASFDCNDIYLQDLNPSELPTQQNVNGNQDGGVASSSQDPSQKPANNTDSKNDKSKEDSHEQLGTTVNVVDQQPTTVETLPKVETKEAATSRAASDSANQNLAGECKPEADKQVIDINPLAPNITTEESIAASALVQVAESQILTSDASNKHNTEAPDESDRQQQYSAMETPASADKDQATEDNGQGTYLFSMSQTSVDAQMEKVIENIVDLGGMHEFPQSIGQVEDKEKVLESIHREITSDHSSIDLIAEVASKQQSIEIQPTMSQVSVESKATEDESGFVPSSATEEINSDAQKIDLSPNIESKQELNLEQPTESIKSDQPSVIETPGDTNEKKETQNGSEESEVVREAGQLFEADKEEDRTEQVVETRIEPIVEEPCVTSESSVTEDKQIENQTAERSDEIPDIIVEPIELVDEKIEPLNLLPVVEEASSADELDQVEKKPAQIDDVTAPEVGAQDGDKKSESKIEIQSTPDAELNRRKSARSKARPINDNEIEPPAPRASRRVSSRKRPVDEDQPVEQTISTAEQLEVVDNQTHKEQIVEQIDAEVQPIPGPSKRVSRHKSETRSEKVEKGETFNEQEEGIEGKEDESKDSKEEERDEEDVPEPSDKSSGRPSRTLRVRAPKRPHEESPVLVEPSKKQAKGSRTTTDDLNKSSGQIKSTPTIKLPALKSRMTISTSDPSTRPGARKECSQVLAQDSDKKYVCHQCDFATDRLNNMVYHTTKSYCKGKSDMAEMMKASIIKQQQQAKGKRRQIR